MKIFFMAAAVVCALPVWGAPPRQSFPTLGVPQSLGTQVSYNVTGDDISHISQLGLRNLRVVVDPQSENWNDVQSLCLSLWRQGITPFLILMTDVNNPPSNEAAWDAFAGRAQALAGFLRNTNLNGPIVWEIWNEPMGNKFWAGAGAHAAAYAQLAVRTAYAIHATNPHLVVAGSLATMSDVPFLEAMLATRPDLLQNLDGISVHGYENSGHEPPEERLDFYHKVRNVMNKHGRVLPIVTSELGWQANPPRGKVTSNGSGSVSEGQQANYMARLYLVNFLAGIPLTTEYKWQSGWLPGRRYDGYGLLNEDGDPRKAYWSVGELIEELNGFAYAGAIAGGGADFALAFANQGEGKVVAWTTGKPHKMLVSSRHCGIHRLVTGTPQYLSMDPSCF